MVGDWSQENAGDGGERLDLEYLLKFELRLCHRMDLGMQRIKDEFWISGQSDQIMVTICFQVGEHQQNESDLEDRADR